MIHNNNIRICVWEDPAMTVKCRTAIKALFLYFNLRLISAMFNSFSCSCTCAISFLSEQFVTCISTHMSNIIVISCIFKEPSQRSFQLALKSPELTKVFKFSILTMVGLRNVFWTHQIKLLQGSHVVLILQIINWSRCICHIPVCNLPTGQNLHFCSG